MNQMKNLLANLFFFVNVYFVSDNFVVAFCNGSFEIDFAWLCGLPRPSFKRITLGLFTFLDGLSVQFGLLLVVAQAALAHTTFIHR